MDQAMTALSYVIGGIVVYGGIGWLLAHFLHLQFLIPIGIVVGAGLSTYLIVKRFGKPGDEAVESWIEQKKAKEAEWARMAGRPERPAATTPSAPTSAPTPTSARTSARTSAQRKDHLT
jgi:hypothetical protein